MALGGGGVEFVAPEEGLTGDAGTKNYTILTITSGKNSNFMQPLEKAHLKVGSNSSQCASCNENMMQLQIDL